MLPSVALVYANPKSVPKRLWRVRTPPECRAFDMLSGWREANRKEKLASERARSVESRMQRLVTQ
jgi:hypothetical protein